MTFNVTLWNDLQAAGIFDMVSREFLSAVDSGRAARGASLGLGQSTAECQHVGLRQPRRAGRFINVQGWLYDAKNPQSPQVLGKQYREQATDANAR